MLSTTQTRQTVTARTGVVGPEWQRCSIRVPLHHIKKEYHIYEDEHLPLAHPSRENTNVAIQSAPRALHANISTGGKTYPDDLLLPLLLESGAS